METTSQITPKEEESNPRSLLSIIIIPTDQTWVVVFVAFCQNFLLESVPLTILLLASDLQSGDFVTTYEKYCSAALFFGFSSILTPLSCSLVNWYSFKVISVIGPAVICSAMILTYFTQAYFIYSMIILSLIGGLGNSMMNATSMCLPTVWFCNRRALACQISHFGQSLGIMIIPWFTKRIFIENFKFSTEDVYLLYAGMYVPLIALGLAVPKLYGISLEVRNSRKVITKVKFRDQETAATLARSMSILGNVLSYLIFKTYHNLMFPRVKDIIRERSLYMLIPDHGMATCVDPPYRKDIPKRHKAPISEDSSALSFSFYGVQNVQMLKSCGLPGHGCRPFYRVDIFYSANVTELNIYYRQMNQLDYHMAVSLAMTRKDFQQEVNQKCPIFPEAISRALISMLHMGMWKHLYFIFLQIALALCYFAHFIPFIFINDRGLEFGLKEKSYSVINFIGFGHLFGGFLELCSNYYCCEMDYVFFFEFLLVSEGVFSIISNYYGNYAFQLVYGFLTGIYMSLSVMVINPAVCRISGIFNLSNAMGYVLIFQGIGILGGTLVCVNVNEHWETVKHAYHISGLCMLLSAILLAPLKTLKKKSRELETDLV